LSWSAMEKMDNALDSVDWQDWDKGLYGGDQFHIKNQFFESFPGVTVSHQYLDGDRFKEYRRTARK